MSPYIKTLSVQAFRNYDQTRIDALPKGFIVLVGANGAGKTNMLEAVSLLAPGRGLRSSKISDMQKHGAARSWAVSANVETEFGEVTIGTGANSSGDKRLIRIQGEPVRSQAALGEYTSCVWLTPQMDGLFRGSSSDRRRFLDRLIISHDPAHAGRVTRYENALSQRSKLLKASAETGALDTSWVAALERQMAETGIAISAARLDYIKRLAHAVKKSQSGDEMIFPTPRLELTGQLEEKLETQAAVEVEDIFCRQLEKSRSLDMVQGGASIGPHRTDMKVTYSEKNMPAALCSTGEQKALLIGLILAHTYLLISEKNTAPLLLLDEVVAHLDEHRRAHLFDILENFAGQVWMSGTDESAFSHIKDKAYLLRVSEKGIIEPC